MRTLVTGASSHGRAAPDPVDLHEAAGETVPVELHHRFVVQEGAVSWCPDFPLIVSRREKFIRKFPPRTRTPGHAS